ncbi:hypothetical protein Scep_020777 [Stephania cephalantha]|uniref:Thaumatin-like protein 1b n=1 Tax=Stephania cephalantha TaxID=152367 RepID=A0AAP0NNH9_9MAGN
MNGVLILVLDSVDTLDVCYISMGFVPFEVANTRCYPGAAAEMGLMAHHQLWFTALSLVCLLSVSFVTAGTGRFTIINKCTHPVWPGVLANAGSTPLSTTGFLLQEGESVTLSSPPSWSGRFWGRTLCTTQGYSTTGTKFACATGDCGSNTIECSGAGATPPATLAEFTLNGADGLDFYDVSLVDGYNLPMLVAPQQLEEESRRSSGNCSSTGCLADINSVCPKELRLRLLSNEDESDSLACKSACDAFEQPEYCCSGEYANPQTCKPSSYSELFKKACPLAYSYAYDDGTSTFTCSSSPNYAITFCPPLPSRYLRTCT